jgi:predicted DNA-binding transcriptional regulator AlpA
MMPPPRVRASAIALMTGLSVRKVQELAAAGKLPGAAKLGGVWTFDPQKVRAWIEEREAHASRPRPRVEVPAVRHVASKGDVTTWPAESIDAAFELLIRRKGRKKK